MARVYDLITIAAHLFNAHALGVALSSSGSINMLTGQVTRSVSSSRRLGSRPAAMAKTAHMQLLGIGHARLGRGCAGRPTPFSSGTRQNNRELLCRAAGELTLTVF